MNTFCSFLKTMERFGQWGRSRDLVFYCDGDGDFNPKFEMPDFQTKQGKIYPHSYGDGYSECYFFDCENKDLTREDENDINKLYLPINENIFVKQNFENEEKFQERIMDLSIDLSLAKNEEEYNNIIQKAKDAIKR